MVGGTTNRTPVRDRPGALGWRRGSLYRGSRVMPVEGRGLSSRRTQDVVRDLGIGQRGNRYVRPTATAPHLDSTHRAVCCGAATHSLRVSYRGQCRRMTNAVLIPPLAEASPRGCGQFRSTMPRRVHRVSALGARPFPFSGRCRGFHPSHDRSSIRTFRDDDHRIRFSVTIENHCWSDRCADWQSLNLN